MELTEFERGILYGTLTVEQLDNIPRPLYDKITKTTEVKE